MADTPEAPKPGTPEHDAAMAAKAEDNAKKAAEAAAPQTLEAPAEEPNKPQEEVPKEEEKPAEESPEKKPEEPAQEEVPKEEEKPAEESPALDMNALQAEYVKDGTLSQESYDKLAKVGFDKNYVDAFIAGQEALRAQQEAKVLAAAGGEEQFNAMKEWAIANFDKAETDAYNKAVAGDEAEMLQAVNGLKARYEAAYGKEPRLIGGSNPRGATGYESREQMVADMRDPRYGKDPAFRAQVERRIAASTAF